MRLRKRVKLLESREREHWRQNDEALEQIVSIFKNDILALRRHLKYQHGIEIEGIEDDE